MKVRLLRFTMLILAVLISATGVWAADTKPNLKYNEDGGYYEIASAEDMIMFANFCRNAKSPTCVDMTFKVTVKELDLGTEDFKRITGEFGGTMVRLLAKVVIAEASYGSYTRQCYYCDGTGRDPASSEKSSDSESSGSIFDLFFK